jgi:transcriptional regulator with XRE-family HTH domain
MVRFGVLFGRLVREKRGIEGLSLDGLAEKSGLTKARISDIETGKVANPQAKTVDALCVALNISREERAACHTAPASGLPSRLLRKLAQHFGRAAMRHSWAATSLRRQAISSSRHVFFRASTPRWRRTIGTSVPRYEKNLQFALSLELSALRHLSKSDNPREWGVVHHNLGCRYLDLSEIRIGVAKSITDVENAIYHAKLSFEVRNPDDSLQYWVASCRTLGEALLRMSSYSIEKDSTKYVQRARDVLRGAAARISPSEHPLQWEQIQNQLAKCRE